MQAEGASEEGTEDDDLRSVALRNAQSILLTRNRAEEELVAAKQALETSSNELGQSLAVMRATLEAATDGIFVTTADGRATHFNKKFLTIWGLDPEQVEGQSHLDIASRVAHLFEDPDGVAARIHEIYASPKDELNDLLYLADGRTFERVSRFLDGSPQSGRVWSFRDITARTRAEEALRDEARMLNLLNQTGSTIAATLDLSAVLQSVTDAATQLSGAKFGAFFYKSVDERGEAYDLYTLSGAPREAFEAFGHPRPTPVFSPTFKGEGPVRSDDITVDGRYGRWGPHYGMPRGHLPVRSYLAVPVTLRNGETIGGLLFGHPEAAVFNERTQRLVEGVAAHASVALDNARLYEEMKRTALERERLVEAERAARAQTERVSRLKDQFLATLSHELRTPLTAILGWSKVLMRTKGDPANLDKALNAIARNAAAQAKLIDDLLDMNRIISGKVRLDVQPTDLASVIDEAIDSVRPALDAKGLKLRKILDPLAGPVFGDPNRLQQVVWNLLSNAVKFTPRDGRIEVVLSRVNSHVEISVTDSGIGIDPSFIPHVFDRFRQADSSTTRSQGGLGLGLSIVKHLVELHGGTVHAKSEGDRRGASFIAALPLASVYRNTEREHPTTQSGGNTGYDLIELHGVKVLVIDDDSDARELVKQLLVECHADVTTAESASEGLRLLPSLRPNVLVSDIGMPDCDGYEFIRRVRRLTFEDGGRTPAIALTAFARSEDRTMAMRAGFQVHVAKPIEPHELMATVASLAGRTQAQSL